jgi:hypothetical protein
MGKQESYCNTSTVMFPEILPKSRNNLDGNTMPTKANWPIFIGAAEEVV